MTPGLARFRKHHRPCGQPAVVGDAEFFRPLPAQVGHFKRVNATPSDLPLISTGLATYPVPPQRGQLFGSILPLSCKEFFTNLDLQCHKVNPVTKHEQARISPSDYHGDETRLEKQT
jgi:hypothetical protein